MATAVSIQVNGPTTTATAGGYTSEIVTNTSVRGSDYSGITPGTITRTYHPVKGVYVSLPEQTVPPWAVALMVIGGLILIGLLAVLIQSRRRLARPVPAAGAIRHGRARVRARRLLGMPGKRTVT